MGHVTDELRRHHREILDTLSGHIDAIEDDRLDADPHRMAAFLRDEVLHHAVSEEEHLYRPLEHLVAEHGKPMAGMSIDHEYIEGYIDWIEETAEELDTADPEERLRLQTLLRKLCWQLQAVLELHLAKEERICLPLMAQYLSEDTQAKILDLMNQTEHQAFEEEREPFYAHKVAVVA
jgi:hemerythrin-like domain-containing protein